MAHRPGRINDEAITLSQSLAGDADDAARWWLAYQLAEDDRADELRQRAGAGDDHARRQLASWLSDRGRTQEAITVIRPLADAGDDLALLWLVRCLAEDERTDEMRQRAEAAMIAPGRSWPVGWPGMIGLVTCASSLRPRTPRPLSGSPGGGPGGATSMCCACSPTWEMMTPGGGWPSCWPDEA